MKERLAEKIAGEVALSDNPGKTLEKWRSTFNISQQELARFLKISPSVISDYEGGRRKSPGVNSVKRIIFGLIEIDEKKGGNVLKKYSFGNTSNAIFALREFSSLVNGKRFVETIEGKVIECEEFMNRNIHGYTVIDSVMAIMTFNSYDYMKLYGWSTERALIFSGVRYGRSPMVAIRAHPLKPAIVVFHKPENVDELALRLARIEQIPLITTEIPLTDLIERLAELK